jgi:hypothetical protein
VQVGDNWSSTSMLWINSQQTKSLWSVETICFPLYSASKFFSINKQTNKQMFAKYWWHLHFLWWGHFF